MIILSYFSFFFNEKFEKKLMVTLQHASVKPHPILFSNQTLSLVSTEREVIIFDYPCSKIISKRQIRIIFREFARTHQKQRESVQIDSEQSILSG